MRMEGVQLHSTLRKFEGRALAEEKHNGYKVIHQLRKKRYRKVLKKELECPYIKFFCFYYRSIILLKKLRKSKAGLNAIIKFDFKLEKQY